MQTINANVLRFKSDNNSITDRKIHIYPINMDDNGEIFAPQNVYFYTKENNCYIVFQCNNVFIEIGDFYNHNEKIDIKTIKRFLEQINPENIIEKIKALERPNLLFIAFFKALNLDYEVLSLKREQYDIEKEKKQQEEKERKKKEIREAELNAYKNAYEKIKEGLEISIVDMVKLASFMSIEIKPQTKGAINKLGPNSSMTAKQISYSLPRGKKINCHESLFLLYKTIGDTNFQF